jgi:hypothetical protein
MQRSDFELKKIKLLDNGGTEMISRVTFNDQTVNHADQTVKSTVEPHDDLVTPIRSLKKYLQKVVPLSPGFEDRIKATGIALSGKDENVGVIITGKYETPSGKIVAINSDRITLEGSAYGFEEEMSVLLDTIADECYLYAIEGKKAQLSLFEPKDE